MKKPQKKVINCQVDSRRRLVPFGIVDDELMRDYHKNQILECIISGGAKIEASATQRGLYFACCEQVAQNSGDKNWNTKNKVDYQIRLAIKWIEFSIVLPDGSIQFKVKSISPKTITHFVQNNYMMEAVDIMATKIGVTPEQLVFMAKENMKG